MSAKHHTDMATCLKWITICWHTIRQIWPRYRLDGNIPISITVACELNRITWKSYFTLTFPVLDALRFYKRNVRLIRGPHVLSDLIFPTIDCLTSCNVEMCSLIQKYK